jgi:hypothetical protein
MTELCALIEGPTEYWALIEGPRWADTEFYGNWLLAAANSELWTESIYGGRSFEDGFELRSLAHAPGSVK